MEDRIHHWVSLEEEMPHWEKKNFELHKEFKELKVFNAAYGNDIETVKMYLEKEGVSPTIMNHKVPRETLAHTAIRKDYLDLLKYLLENYPALLNIRYDIMPQQGDCSILALAVEAGHLRIVKYLAERHNADVYDVFLEKYTPVNWAAVKGFTHILRYFIDERGVDVNKPPVRKDSKYAAKIPPVIFFARRYWNPELLRYVIEDARADLTVVDERGENLLYWSLLAEDYDFMKYLVEDRKAKFNYNHLNNAGYALLHYIFVETQIEEPDDFLRWIVEEKHADIDVLTRLEKRTPLHMAAHQKAYDCVRWVFFFIQHGADVNKQDINGDTPLHLAVPRVLGYHGYAICKDLIAHDADVGVRNKEGKTPLDILMTKLSLDYDLPKNLLFDACQLFLEEGADPKATDEEGNRLVHLAALWHGIDFIDYLVREERVDINDRRKTDDWTPLHCAASKNDLQMCESLIKHGADIHAKSKCGKTAAQLSSNRYVIKYLESVSTTKRTRRNVENYFPALLENPTYHEYKYQSIAGSANQNAISFPGESSSFGLQNFVSNISLLFRYFVRGRFNSSYSRRHTFVPAVPLGRIDTIAEDAVHYFANSTDA